VRLTRAADPVFYNAGMHRRSAGVRAASNGNGLLVLLISLLQAVGAADGFGGGAAGGRRDGEGGGEEVSALETKDCAFVKRRGGD
jgi:hypothetical protein